MDQALRHIVHPTDLSRAGLVAFEHALRIALAAKATLTIMHVKGEDEEEEWDDFPGVREVLERWGRLPAGASTDDIKSLGINVRKVSANSSDPVEICSEYLERHPAQLLVMATGQNASLLGWPRWSVASSIAARCGVMTLFMPHSTKGFVHSINGKVELSRVLIPVDESPSCAPAIASADTICMLLDVTVAEFGIYHAGTRDSMPEVRSPDRHGHTWTERYSDEDPVQGIVRASEEQASDLVVMATQGRRGLVDAFLGSTMERVLAHLPRPLLAVPSH